MRQYTCKNKECQTRFTAKKYEPYCLKCKQDMKDKQERERIPDGETHKPKQQKLF